MIAFLRGQVFSKSENELLIDCNGVGYRVRSSQFTLQELPSSGTVFVHIYHHIIEGDQQLFGFASVDERMAFEQLLIVKGIGPKLALTVLSGIAYTQLVEIIVKKQSALLSKVPGIGKKTADRIILELSDRIKLENGGDSTTISAGGETANELISGLLALGYKKAQAETVATKVLGEHPGQTNLSILVRAALRHLNS